MDRDALLGTCAAWGSSVKTQFLSNKTSLSLRCYIVLPAMQLLTGFHYSRSNIEEQSVMDDSLPIYEKN